MMTRKANRPKAAKAYKPTKAKPKAEPIVTNPYALGKYKKKSNSEFDNHPLVKQGALVDLVKYKKHPSVERILAGNTYSSEVTDSKLIKDFGKIMSYDPTLKKLFTYISLHTRQHDLYIFIDNKHKGCNKSQDKVVTLGFATDLKNSVNFCKLDTQSLGTISHEFTHIAVYNMFNRKCVKSKPPSLPSGFNPYDNVQDKKAFQQVKIEVLKNLLKGKSMYNTGCKDLAHSEKSYELGKVLIQSMDKLYQHGTYDNDKCLNIVFNSFYSLYSYYEKQHEDAEFIVRLAEIKAQDCYTEKVKDLIEPLVNYWDMVLKPVLNAEIACLENI